MTERLALRRVRFARTSLGLALCFVPAIARAQQAPPAEQPALPPGHPALPEGHPAVDAPADGNPHGAGAGMDSLPGFRQVQLAEQSTAEAADLPAGVVLVRVVDALGNPVPDATVRLGAMREGERQAAREVRTRADGVAQFDHLDTGSNVAYRPSVDANGARFSATPFQLPTTNGYRVQLVRFETDNTPRSVLISDARVEITFADDRLVVVERANLVNFSSMSLRGDAPHPVAYVPPPQGLRFRLPPGYSAFRVDEQSMGDQRVTDEDGFAVLRGSVPPTGMSGAIPIVFQYRVKITGTDVPLDLTFPLPTLRATILSQAPAGLRLDVEGMPPPEERMHENQRIFITGRERQSREDPPLDTIHIRLSGIPAAAGPERNVAAVTAVGFALASVFAGVRNTRRGGAGGRGKRERAALEAERVRLLREASDLVRARDAGDVGPQTYERRRRELTEALAAVLKALAEIDEPAVVAKKS